MESRRGVTGLAPPAAAQRRCGGHRGGGSGDESDGSSSGVELSLRLKTGSSPPAAAEEEEVEETPAATAAAAVVRRSMTIFYNGRVCAVDVTEIQAREIMSMASQEILGDQQQMRRDDRQVQDSGSSSSSSAMARCGGQVRLTVAPPAADPRQGLAAVGAPVIEQAATGLSMKRSLQRFLQKRKARVDAAVAPPYAGARQAQPLRR